MRELTCGDLWMLSMLYIGLFIMGVLGGLWAARRAAWKKARDENLTSGHNWKP